MGLGKDREEDWVPMVSLEVVLVSVVDGLAKTCSLVSLMMKSNSRFLRGNPQRGLVQLRDLAQLPADLVPLLDDRVQLHQELVHLPGVLALQPADRVQPPNDLVPLVALAPLVDLAQQPRNLAPLL